MQRAEIIAKGEVQKVGYRDALNYTGLETNVLITYSIERVGIITEKTGTIPLGIREQKY